MLNYILYKIKYFLFEEKQYFNTKQVPYMTSDFKTQLLLEAFCKQYSFKYFKLHPNKQKLRQLSDKYLDLIKTKNVLSIFNLDNITRKLAESYIKEWLDIYLNNVFESKLDIILLTEEDNKCVLCYDNFKILDKVMKCNYNHYFHYNCYNEFFNKEENKDDNKQYKCEKNTLCILCYNKIDMNWCNKNIYLPNNIN